MTEIERSDAYMPIKWFSSLNKNSIEEIGQKAAYLAEAYNKKAFSKSITIPNAFVITKDAISKYLKDKKIPNAISNILEETNKQSSEELKRASMKIKELIYRNDLGQELTEEINESYENLGLNKLEMEAGSALDILSSAAEPIFVAVRASFKDERGDSYFNVKGKAAIISSIKKIIASLFTEEMLKEEFEKGINPAEATTAIIIQKMIQGDKSGALYSENVINIEAIWGLAGGLKLDEIGKDNYKLRRDFKIISKSLGEKKYAITRDSSGSLKLIQLKDGYSFAQVMEEYELQELCDTALRLDDIFKEKLQFEFTIEDDNIAVVKIEPLKARVEKEAKEEIILEENHYEESLIKPIIEETELIIPEPTPEPVSTITPVKKATQTKIELFISNEKEAKDGELTGLKKGYLTLENIIKTRGIHPNNYIDNFNTKGYGEIILNGIENNSKGLKEIWVRLSDFTEDEFKGLDGGDINKESNSLFEARGIRFLLNKPELLKRELKAISELKTKDNTVGVLIPKISSVYELKKVNEIIDSIGVPIKVGIILEIPSSIQLIKDFIEEGIDAVLFSGDTLTEYLLGIDRNDPETRKYYDDTNPALMYQLEYVTRVCRRNNVKTSFIGSATLKKEMIDYLVKKNIETIIVSPKEASRTSEMIAKAESEFISGTDKEIRNYELNKEKERQKKELNDFEKQKHEQIAAEIKTMTVPKEEEKVPKISVEEVETIENAVDDEVQEIEVISEGDDECTPEDKVKAIDKSEIVKDVDEAIKLIETEKKEYDKHPKEIEKAEKQTQEKVIIKEPKQEEKYDEVPENMSDIERAMAEIETHNQKIKEGPIIEEPEKELTTNTEGVPGPYTGAEELGPNETANKSMSDVEKAMAEIDAHNQKMKETPRQTSAEKDAAKAMAEINAHNQKAQTPIESEAPDEKFNVGLDNFSENKIEELKDSELNEIDKSISEEKEEIVLKEHPEEVFENTPEDVEKIDKELDSVSITRDIELIEEEKREFTNDSKEEDFADNFSFEDDEEPKDDKEEEEFTRAKDDPLGIF